MRTLLVLVAFTACTASACSKKAEGNAATSLSCYVADQHRCEEAPAATKAQDDARTIECSSVSGKLSRPASCPTSGFVGKCTVVADGATSIHRFYTGTDAAYQKSFCAEPAKGVWSTTF